MATTFAGFPACSDPAGAAIAVLGVPNATPYTVGQASHCAGAPAALRAALTGYATKPEQYDFDIGGLRPSGVVDCGDVAGDPFDPAGTRERITAAVARLLAAGAVPVVLGGDDSVVIPMFRAFAGHGPLTVVQVYPWTGGAIQGAKLEAEMIFPARIKEFLTNWRVSYPITLDGREVDVVQGTGPDNLLATLYFDKQSGLLNRLIHYRLSAVGRVATQIDVSDYRSVGGMMFPFRWSYAWVSGREEYTWTEAQPNVVVDAGRFAKPVPRSR